MKAFYGMMTAIVASTEEPGDIILEATAKGLRKAIIKIQSEEDHPPSFFLISDAHRDDKYMLNL